MEPGELTVAFEYPKFQLNPSATWKDVKYRRLDFASVDVERYCAALRVIYCNDRVSYAAFEATDRDAFLSAYQCDRGDGRSAVEGLLEDEIVLGAFPTEDGISGRLPNPQIVVASKGGCEFEGVLADRLVYGGAYSTADDSAQDVVDGAKLLAAACVSGMRSLLPGRPWRPWHVAGPWSNYFYDVAWDNTFAVQFLYDARWLVLCATDTD